MCSVTLKPAKEKRVYSKHPWVFRSDIDRTDPSAKPGDIVSVFSSKGKFLAKAIYNPNSQIALRIMSYQAVDNSVPSAYFCTRETPEIIARRLLCYRSSALPNRMLEYQITGEPSEWKDCVDKTKKE